MLERDWVTLIPGIVGGINTILMAFGIEGFSDTTVQAIVATCSGILTLIGIIHHHLVIHKDEETPAN